MEENKSVPLPMECIGVIASYLGYRDRANMEMVSRIWRLGSMYSHRNTKIIYINDKLWGNVVVTNRIFGWLLNRCGNELVTIRLEDTAKAESLLPEVIEMIAEYCPNIENLHVSGIKLKPDGILKIATNVSRLRSLSIGSWEDSSCTTDQDKALAIFLHNNVLLESLKIAQYPKEHEFTDPPSNSISEGTLIGKCFLDITPTLRHLDIANCMEIDESLLAEAIRRFHQLESLKIHCCFTELPEILFALAENETLHSTLTFLSIYMEYLIYSQLSAELTVAIVECYKNMTTLHLSACGWITADTILMIGENMTQLEDLNISVCQCIQGEFALDPLTNLTKLETLTMSVLHPSVGGGLLKSLSNLRYLECIGNSGVTDENICDLLRRVNSLRYVNLAGCPNLTRRVVDTVYELRKISRTIPLKICLYKTNIVPQEGDETDSKIGIYYERVDPDRSD